MTSLEQSINRFWELCRFHLSGFDFGALPTDLSGLIRDYAFGNAKQSEVAIVKTIVGNSDAQRDDKHATEILKLFDASSNGYRSITNVLLEYTKIQHAFDRGDYDLNVRRYALLDGMPVALPGAVGNEKVCSVCGRFPQEVTSFALITGGPQTDSTYQTYRNKQTKRGNLEICQYCFTAGWVDLPTAKIIKDGQNINKGREYLFITTPLARKRLERLLDLIIQPNKLESVPNDEEVLSDVPHSAIDDITSSLLGELGIEVGDPLSILGLSTTRLSELRGFVLQSSNQMERTLVLRVPIERIVGEDKVSGGVRRELMKAAMYDFWQITGGSLHYGRLRKGAQFSVDGRVIMLEEMRRAAAAFRIANRYGRIGKYRHLNSGLFMLLLTHPQQAVNQMLRALKRENQGRFAPGSNQVMEVISMIDQIDENKDWQFKLGMEIIGLLVEIGLAPRAKSFWKNQKEQYTGVELVKWIQRIKMIHDENSTRAWGTSLINGYRREKDRGPNTESVERIMSLAEKIINECREHDTSLTEFGRTIANMDYYLLFYYNQKQYTKED